MVVTPHIGCGEVVGQAFGSRMPITVMYNPPKIRALEPVMKVGRSRGTTIISVPADLRRVRAMLKAHRRGDEIGILPDQVPGAGDGDRIDLFRGPAYTLTRVWRLAGPT